MKWPPPWLERLQGSGPDLATREDAARRAERAISLGNRLRDARVAAGLSLADVERDTRINRTYVEAIEAARFDALPAPVYARGFTRSYARYLGLDPEEAVSAVPSDLPRPMGLEPMPGLRRTAPPTLPGLSEGNMPILVGLGVVGVLLVALIFLVPRVLDFGGDGLPDDATGTPTATATLPSGTSTSTGTPAATATGTPSGTPVVSATVPPFEDGEAPDFTGVSREEAERVLTEIGATPVIVEASDSTPAGLVFDQSPAPGTGLQEGDVVTLFISSGP